MKESHKEEQESAGEPLEHARRPFVYRRHHALDERKCGLLVATFLSTN